MMQKSAGKAAENLLIKVLIRLSNQIIYKLVCSFFCGKFSLSNHWTKYRGAGGTNTGISFRYRTECLVTHLAGDLPGHK